MYNAVSIYVCLSGCMLVHKLSVRTSDSTRARFCGNLRQGAAGQRREREAEEEEEGGFPGRGFPQGRAHFWVRICPWASFLAADSWHLLLLLSFRSKLRDRVTQEWRGEVGVMLTSWPRRVLSVNSSRANGPKYNEGHDDGSHVGPARACVNVCVHVSCCCLCVCMWVHCSV